MNDSQILIRRYREIIKRKQSRGRRSDSMKILQQDIHTAYTDKPMPTEILFLLDEVEAQIC